MNRHDYLPCFLAITGDVMFCRHAQKRIVRYVWPQEARWS